MWAGMGSGQSSKLYRKQWRCISCLLGLAVLGSLVRGEWAAGKWCMSDVSALQLPSPVCAHEASLPFHMHLLDSLHDSVCCSSTLCDLTTMVNQGLDISLDFLLTAVLNT